MSEHTPHTPYARLCLWLWNCLPYSVKNIYWALEQISVQYLVREGKFADIANALLKVSTKRDSPGIGKKTEVIREQDAEESVWV